MNDKTTREHIVEVSDRLFYQRGFEHTSFADIAGVLQISRGNFYYHFKSKHELLSAVIDARLAETRAMLARWEGEFPDPGARIRRYIDILLVNRADIQRYGCPVGMLCSELVRLRHGSRGQARAVFSLFQTWLARQFQLLGRAADADELAMHLIARSQGVALMSNAFRDEPFVRHEVELLYDWLQACTRAGAVETGGVATAGKQPAATMKRVASGAQQGAKRPSERRGRKRSPLAGG